MTFLEILPYLQSNFFSQLLFAAFCGGLIGLEREISGKPAGIRTCALVSMGAAIFTILSVNAVDVVESTGVALDKTRIASNIVQGIGFLGAVCVWMSKDKINGVTTAASIWVVSAVGMAVGFGFFPLALNGALLTITILFAIGWIERVFKGQRKIKTKKRSKRHGTR